MGDAPVSRGFDNFRVTASAAPVPVPSTLNLGAIGLVGLALGYARRRRWAA